MEDAKVADRLILLAHGHLVQFYEGLGFDNKGKSKATFGGGGWYDMVCISLRALYCEVWTKVDSNQGVRI